MAGIAWDTSKHETVIMSEPYKHLQHAVTVPLVPATHAAVITTELPGGSGSISQKLLISLSPSLLSQHM